MSIKLSILVPVYKVETYVAECIESVLSQTYGNFELILVDDGSPDRSGKICDEFAEKDSRISVYHKQNQGLIHTRRYAIERANGDYCIFLDSDDSLKPGALCRIVEAIEKYHCDCIVYGFERVLNGKSIYVSKKDEQSYVTDKKEIYKSCLLDSNYNAIWRKAVKKEVFDGRDYREYYHLQLGEDLLQSIEILQNSKSMVFLPDALYNYRVNPNSMTQTKAYSNYSIDYTIRNLVIQFLYDENVFSESDWCVFYSSCVEQWVQQIAEIGTLSTTIQNKKKLFMAMRQTSFYTAFLSKKDYQHALKGKNWFVFSMFQKRFDWLNICLFSVYKKARRILQHA